VADDEHLSIRILLLYELPGLLAKGAYPAQTGRITGDHDNGTFLV
jgi:hypothetical protein